MKAVSEVPGAVGTQRTGGMVTTVVRVVGLAGGLALLGFGGYGLLTDQYVSGHQLQVALWAAGAIVLHDGVWVPVLLAAGALLARLVPEVVRIPVRTGLMVAAAVSAVGIPAALREHDHNGNATLLPLPYLRNWLLVLLVVAVLTGLASALTVLRDHGRRQQARPGARPHAAEGEKAAMARTHSYRTEVGWTGNRGTGTSDYRSYDRSHDIDADGRPRIQASSDPAFRGDPARWNPELLLVASVSECHMLWYLHYCAVGGVVVTGYTDAAEGTMSEDEKGGRFTEVVLRPRVEVASAEMVARAEALHADAHRACFIANSVNFPVRHEGAVTVRSPSEAEEAGPESGLTESGTD
ncbi:OsmC family protein [Streptacidiphilus sp. EB129]|uniref:OsmC family protein n=1 Tax=Streptacidiphilus sp. EB129 TaxID=3156262 RepID=UPI00351361E2